MPYHPHATFYTELQAIAYIEKHNLDAHIYPGVGDGKYHVMPNNKDNKRITHHVPNNRKQNSLRTD